VAKYKSGKKIELKDKIELKGKSLRTNQLDNVNTVPKNTSSLINTSIKNKSITKKFRIIGASIVVLLLVASGCYLYFNHVSEHKIRPIQHITVALNWVHHAEFAGNYVAVEKGFYDIHGINATLIPYNFNNSTIDLVVGGKADFGVASASEVMLARSKGIPVKAIAVIYQINPVCAFSLKSSGITSPQDFIGKTIGIEKGVDDVKYEYIAMMEKLGINRSNLKEVETGYDASELLNGTVDVSTGYVTNEPYYVTETGQDVNIIMVEDYGINIYSDVLFATDDMIAKNPDLTLNFVQATLDGWQYSLEHQDESLDIVMHYAIGADKAHEGYALDTSLDLINTGEVPIGYMTEEGWLNVKNALLLQHLLVNPVSLSDCYTAQFYSREHTWNKI
jgi:ABC-type nitrate/sulfonate/bicarbonate transport system substrate-binding protein